MAPLKVIGAGCGRLYSQPNGISKKINVIFYYEGRTGTWSLKIALDKLG